MGLMGLGVVGGGVASALLQEPSAVSSRVGRPVNLRRVLVRDRSRPRDVDVPAGLLTTNAEDILDDPEIDILVEVMGGSDPASGYLRRALEAGKHVVTANKEVMAKDGAELMALARANQVSLLFEASVGGGIPIVGCLMNELAANDVYSIRSIINGTTNYILTQMAQQRTAFGEALAEAQGLGYAESDPTNDVEGIDAAYKLTVLATLAYGSRFRPEDVYRQGISDLEPQDFRYAQEFGFSIKSLAIADLDEGGVQLRVYPALGSSRKHARKCQWRVQCGRGARKPVWPRPVPWNGSWTRTHDQRCTRRPGRDGAPGPRQRVARRSKGIVPGAGRSEDRHAPDSLLHQAGSGRQSGGACPDCQGAGRRRYQHCFGASEGCRS